MSLIVRVNVVLNSRLLLVQSVVLFLLVLLDFVNKSFVRGQ